MQYQIVDAVMARASMPTRRLTHPLFAWIVMRGLPEYPGALVDARTILLAAMAAFFANVCHAFARVTDTASATMTPAIHRWLCKLPTCTRELMSGRG